MEERLLISTLECHQCLECDRPWLDGRERWRAYVGEDGDLLVYCAACASREFDS